MFGVGLRWWYTDNYSSFQPPNAFFEMLSSGGILGLAGFLVLCLAGLWVALTLPPRYGTIVAAVMLARFTQGQLDLYWVAGQASIPWMMAGLAIGVMAYDRSKEPDGLDATAMAWARRHAEQLKAPPPPSTGRRFKQTEDPP